MLASNVSPHGPVLQRKMGEGPRAEVFLARSGGDPVAVKVYRLATSRASVELELEALSRARSPHCVRLIDVESTEATGSPIAILERLPRGSLAALMERRGALRLGEAITILAPIATAVDALHAAGVAHGAIAAPAVMFRDDGAPVLARFGGANLVNGRTPATRSSEQAVCGDRRALGALVRAVLGRVNGLTEDAIERVVGDAEDADDAGASVALRLFALAPAAPVMFEEPSAVWTPPIAPIQRPRAVQARSRGHLVSALSRFAPTAVVDGLARVADGLRRVRRPLWVVAGAGGVALLLAIITIAAGSGPHAETARVSSTLAPSATARSAPSAQSGTDALSGTDPLAAFRALLEVRSSCVAALSTDCLAGVDQRGSTAEVTDLQLVDAARGGAKVPALDGRNAAIAQRLGDSVLIRLARPAAHATSAVLIMRTADGWRIRDYLVR